MTYLKVVPFQQIWTGKRFVVLPSVMGAVVVLPLDLVGQLLAVLILSVPNDGFDLKYCGIFCCKFFSSNDEW